MSATLKATYGSLPKVTRGKFTVLKGDPKGKTFLYTNNKSVFIRDVEDFAKCDVYTDHAKDTTVAAYAPSGNYICSGDITGNVRIWDTTQKDHLLKYEYPCIGGAIKDIAWSPDSKRIVVVGEGRESFAKVFLWDSGSTVGNLNGSHSATINCVDYKPTRPFRICTGSEDRTVGFHEGPPFKFKHLNSEPTNFVNCIGYAPSGDFFIAGSADGKLCLYDGKEGNLVAEIVDPALKKAHSGGIYGLSWSDDSKFILTASGDKSCKIWNIEDKSLQTVFEMGSNLEDQQLGCLWMGDNLLSVSLSGNINYLDRNNPSTPSRIIKGHYKNISAVAASSSHKKIYSASFDGRIVSWAENGQGSYFKGKGHENHIPFMQVVGDELVTCSLQDEMRFTPLDTEEYGDDKISFDSQPKRFGAGKDGLLIVAFEQQHHVVIVRNKKVVHTVKVPYEPTSASVHIGQDEVAVGSKRGDVYIYKLDQDTLEEKTQISGEKQEVIDLAYSPDGGWLAVASDRKIFCFQKIDYKEITKDFWTHNAKITSIAWSQDSKHIASSSLDTNIRISCPNNPKAKNLIEAAHPKSSVTSVAWYDNDTLVSVGHDCCVRLWNISPL
ncbi:predicted protein [Nematostella vectensis]|uniref:Actin-interacting protein 1 n=1 Tax=Nematostella vectensis TaxID=45351 RepID=A7RZB4_NEMVE|nr:WD repeat-containing protein 1-B [Nematostella vectensis]EDO43209.1 predicted protein [Nematostella vectensis]|eukprot:XP_001635272.1 predicted protein [Nematostella vectensis]